MGGAAVLALPFNAHAAPPGFDAWRDDFRARALAKGISDATWTRAMARVEPDMSVFKELRNQPDGDGVSRNSSGDALYDRGSGDGSSWKWRLATAKEDEGGLVRLADRERR